MARGAAERAVSGLVGEAALERQLRRGISALVLQQASVLAEASLQVAQLREAVSLNLAKPGQVCLLVLLEAAPGWALVGPVVGFLLVAAAEDYGGMQEAEEVRDVARVLLVVGSMVLLLAIPPEAAVGRTVAILGVAAAVRRGGFPSEAAGEAM